MFCNVLNLTEKTEMITCIRRQHVWAEVRRVYWFPVTAVQGGQWAQPVQLGTEDQVHGTGEAGWYATEGNSTRGW